MPIPKDYATNRSYLISKPLGYATNRSYNHQAFLFKVFFQSSSSGHWLSIFFQVSSHLTLATLLPCRYISSGPLPNVSLVMLNACFSPSAALWSRVLNIYASTSLWLSFHIHNHGYLSSFGFTVMVWWLNSHWLYIKLFSSVPSNISSCGYLIDICLLLSCSG